MVLGNEVLDAIPVHIVGKQQGMLIERGVVWQDGFAWEDKPLTDGQLFNDVAALELPEGYITELSPAATGLIHSLANCLTHGVIVMLDYGFGASEYYHPQRRAGTLMCHFQHHAHDNPLLYVGLQDITAHVNFTAIAEAAVTQQLGVLGYLNQANFLINCGLLQLLERTSPEDMQVYTPMVSAAQKLLSPAEMGELFKVILLGKGINEPLIGALQGDKRHTL
jgi:SAM-dependent MidA family methyltransferase